MVFYTFEEFLRKIESEKKIDYDFRRSISTDFAKADQIKPNPLGIVDTKPETVEER